MVGSARDRGTAGPDLNLVRTGGFRAPRQDEQRRQAVPQIGRAEYHEQRRRRKHAAHRHEVTAHRSAIDGALRFERAAFLGGELDESIDERRRMIRRGGFDGFDGAQDLGFERAVVFFEVQRHLRIAHAAQQRLDDGAQQQRHDDKRDRDAEADDRGGGKLERLEPGGGEQERERRAADDDDGAAQR